MSQKAKLAKVRTCPKISGKQRVNTKSSYSDIRSLVSKLISHPNKLTPEAVRS